MQSANGLCFAKTPIRRGNPCGNNITPRGKLLIHCGIYLWRSTGVGGNAKEMKYPRAIGSSFRANNLLTISVLQMKSAAHFLAKTFHFLSSRRSPTQSREILLDTQLDTYYRCCHGQRKQQGEGHSDEPEPLAVGHPCDGKHR